MNNNFISVIIPCYGSEKTINGVVLDCINTLKQRNKKYEIILINDCSKDNVWNEIVKLSEKYPKIVKGISLAKNFGQHAAIMAGFEESNGDVVVTMDDDGQTDPKDIWKLIDKVNEGYDIAIAHYPEFKESAFRRFGSSINRLMAENLVNQPKSIKDSSYRAVRRYVVDEMLKYDKPYPYLAGLMFRVTQNVVEVEVEHHERVSGSSGYSLKKLVNLTLNGFTAFSIKPLRIATLLGFVIAIIGFIYSFAIIVKKIVNTQNVLLGYSSIMSIILIIGGILMILLGLIGEYIGRIYISINNSPQYVIKEKTKN